MVQDSWTTTKIWHQSIALAWYDCPVCVEMMALTVLLRLDICLDGNHHRKKCMNAQSTLWRWCHLFYKNPLRSMKKVRAYIAIQNSWIHPCWFLTWASEGRAQTICPNILLYREVVRLTLVKLDVPVSSWHDTNIVHIIFFWIARPCNFSTKLALVDNLGNWIS